jgi:hypothetical protein
MSVNLDVGNNRYPEVIWVDADKRGNVVNLIFGTRVEGQGGLRLRPPNGKISSSS